MRRDWQGRDQAHRNHVGGVGIEPFKSHQTSRSVLDTQLSAPNTLESRKSRQMNHPTPSTLGRVIAKSSLLLVAKPGKHSAQDDGKQVR